MGASNQLNIFLLLFGGLQGILLTIFLIQKKSYRSAYRWLIAYILVMIVQVLAKVVSKSWLMENSDFFYFSSYQLPFLYGPLVYLLAIELRHPNQKMSMRHSWHFAPFALAVFSTFLNVVVHYYIRPTALLTDVRITLWLQVLSILGYHYAAYREHTKPPVESFVTTTVQAQWLRKFIITSSIVSLTIVFSIFFLYVTFPRLTELRWLFSFLTLFIYWISYKAISQPEVFAVIRGGAGGGPPLQASMKLSVVREKLKYASSRLTVDASTTISDSLNKLMTIKKVYLDPEVSLDTLAQRIGCSRHHLSQVINEREGLSFYDYVNRFRIEEAMVQLADISQNQKIASIAFASGFNSLSTFNDVFKKIAGLTPSDYRKQAAQKRRKQV